MVSDVHCGQAGRTVLDRIRSSLLVPAVVVGVLASAAHAQYGGGSGTPADPYLIRTAEHFVEIGKTQADWGKQFKLMDDIDLTGYDETNLQLIGYWHGLGHMSNQPFHGLFDGNGKTISNFRYRNMNQDYVGLFQYVSAGEVSHLTLSNATVASDGSGAGSLVGNLDGGSVIACQARDVEVTGNRYVGGLIGYVDGGVSQCSSTGYVSGVQDVGGLIGRVGEGNVARSYSKASVLGVEYVGGFAGALTNEVAVIKECYATGSVTGSSYVGGLVGLVAQGRVFHCYSAGPVSADQPGGGLVGNKMFLGDVIDCFWDVETSGQTESGGGTGKTTQEMRSFDTYNWDFWITWAICDGMNYPVFYWQIPQADLRCPDGVEVIDFAWFALKWRDRNCNRVNDYCAKCDFDESGDVGFPDLAILAEDWLVGVE